MITFILYSCDFLNCFTHAYFIRFLNKKNNSLLGLKAPRPKGVCVCACVRLRVRACVRAHVKQSSTRIPVHMNRCYSRSFLLLFLFLDLVLCLRGHGRLSLQQQTGD